MAVADNRILAEEAHPHLIVSQTGVAAQAVTRFTLDILLVEHEVYRRPLEASLDIHLGKLIPRAGTVTHVRIEGQIFVVQLIGMDGDGVDIGLAIADTVGTAIDIDARVAAHLAADVTEVNLTLLQIALNQTIGSHVHIQVETRHRVLEALHIQRALVQLALNLGGSALEILDQGHHGTGSVQVGVVVLVLDGDAGDPWCAVQRATGLIGNEQAAIELPVDIPQREVGIPLLGAQIDVTLGMQARLAVAHAVVHAQTVQVQVTHIAVGSEDVVVVADRAVGIGVKVAALVGTGGIHVGIAAT